ncbi:hypothetical protein MM440_04340 [Arsenicicoccus piscis]|uniref:UPF0225 protein GCM10025862_10560 n=1 Tax=Arsenicicoccus piscis TaxID=673954 RepID=A0ABQ6HN53_9MICO|nr:YchJ family metal-binding protein [Arsenicicoccus piscis]MCH8627033.1 hypothetical protein [Arsenicicoccus piscis]GMA19035.1 UPF0225 protein [Arsenicicoccus piscis]
MSGGAAFGLAPAARSGECPCGSGRPLSVCCRPIHLGQREAATPEELMRSRYTAFALGDADYLLRSWDPLAAPGDLRLDHEREWVGLRVLRSAGGAAGLAGAGGSAGRDDDTGVVEYQADSVVAGRRHRLHEIARFRRHHGRWVYVDGDFPD